MEVWGHTVVDPTLGKDRELVAPISDYFGEIGEAWFGLDEQKRKDFIRKRDDHSCQLCSHRVESDEVHEIVTKGSASVRALVPWNQITVCRDHHQLLQEHKWQIYHFDPLDREHGLVVLDTEGRPVETLWFYERPNPELVEALHKDYRWLTEYAERLRGQKWEAAVRLIRLKDNGAWKHIGESSHKALVASTGADSNECSRLEKAMRLAIDKGVADKAILVDPDRAYKILRAFDGEEEGLERALIDVSGMSQADWIVWYNETLKNSRHVKRHAINFMSDNHYQQYEVDADDPDGMDADLVIDGGRVVKGTG